MGARRFIPHAILAVLTLLAVGALALGISEVPTVVTNRNLDNATAATFSGAVSFSMRITSSVSSFGSSGFIGQVRLIVYNPPDSLVVYQTSPTHHRLGTQTPHQIAGDLAQYAEVPGGSTPWVAQHGTYVRTEPLPDYLRRVYPGQPVASGSAHEVMTVRNGYLISMHLDVSVAQQNLGNGQTAIGGVIHETYTLLRINGSSVQTTGA